MGFSHVQGALANGSGTVSTLSVSLGSNPTPGDLVCVGISLANQSTYASSMTVKDGNGNAYTVTPSSPAFFSAAGFYCQIWLAYLVNAPSNANATITVSWTTASYAHIWAEEFSGGTATFDKDATANSSTGSAYTLNLPSITPTNAGELLYSTVNPLGSVTAPAAGATLGAWTGAAGGISSSGPASEYDLSASSATAVDYTDNTSGDTYCAMAMAFSLTGAAAFQPDEDFPAPTGGPQAADQTATMWEG